MLVDTVPADALAESVYVIERPLALRVLIPVTASAAEVVSVTVPALEAPPGAPSATLSVTPVGIMLLIATVTFLLVSFVVTEYVVVASETEFGGLPALAAVTFIVAGLPETAMVFTALTENVTVCVAVTCA